MSVSEQERIVIIDTIKREGDTRGIKLRLATQFHRHVITILRTFNAFKVNGRTKPIAATSIPKTYSKRNITTIRHIANNDPIY